MNNCLDKFIIIGYIFSSYGINGWNKVISYTDPINNIFNYYPIFIKNKNSFKKIIITQSKFIKKNFFILKIKESNNRNDSDLFSKKFIIINENILPKLHNEFYWKDLIDCYIILKTFKVGKVINITKNKFYDILIVKKFKKENKKNNNLFIPILIDKFIENINILEKKIYIKNFNLLNF